MITGATEALIAAGLTTRRACELTGYARASFYRHHRTPAPVRREPVHQRDRHQPAALCDAERGQILEVLAGEEYAQYSVGQAFYRHWDTGCYIASRSTWYRVARDHALVGDRRRQARSKPKKIPELTATAPNQVWSWDITKLKSTTRGIYFHLYVLMDIYSRYVTGWALHHYEDGDLAKDLIATASTANGGPPGYLHSDNGAAMVSGPVSTLAGQLGVKLSFSRPKVSNDNPYSEALFKTVKYDLAFPEVFDSYDDALAYCQWFFHTYNTTHRHSGIAGHTPATVHHHRTSAIDAVRQAAMNAARDAHPERFSTPPRPPQLPDLAHINGKTTNHTPLSQTG